MNGSVALIQGIYYVLTGLWPLISIRTFQQVTGPKTDLWLVKTIGILIAVIGAALCLAGMRGDVSPPLVLLAVASAVGLASVDVIYVSTRVISRIYLMDAVVELVLIGWWLMDLTASGVS